MESRIPLVLSSLLLAAGLRVAAQGSQAVCLEEARGKPKDDTAYALRDRGRYCDGLLFRPNAGSGELPVIGVTLPGLQALHGQTPLKLAFFGNAPQGSITGPVRVLGLAKLPEVSYRLDALVPAGSESLEIGRESALTRTRPTPLTVGDIAWVAWSDSAAQGRTYLPVAPAGANSGPVEVLVRPTIPTALLTYEIRAGSGALTPNIKLEGGAIGALMRIQVPPGEPDLVVLAITAVGNAGDTQVASVRMVRPRR